MAIKFKDCVGCLKVIYPQFKFAFLFDYLQGHAKKLANGLDAYSMNRGFGGGQTKCVSQKKAEDGYRGMYARTLDVGNAQSLVFKPEDVGQFWMATEERELNRHDRILPPLPGNPRTRNKTIAERKAELVPLYILNDRHQYWLMELQELARSKNIDTKTIRT
jgi:hypothetical protein